MILVCGGLLVALGPHTAEAQAPGTLEGRVLDAESGDPLSGANVQILGTQRGAATDDDGRFALSALAGLQLDGPLHGLVSDEADPDG